MSEQEIVIKETYDTLSAALKTLRAHKPNDRSAADRAWAVSITMMEQALAYFYVWVQLEVQNGKKE